MTGLAAEGLRFLIGAGLGVIIGSFLGALVMRWPRGESVMRGRSHCDACGRTIGLRDLIPLIGALLQRGRCRHCGAPIDAAHMAMEAGCALIGGIALWTLPPFAGLVMAAGGWLLLTLALFDARHFWLPDALTLPLVTLGLTLGDWILPAPFWDRAIGAALGYGVLFILARSYRYLRGREGLGLGDAKLLGAIGAWTGWQILPLVLLLASSAGLLWALMLKLRGRTIESGTRLPLGTFLCGAAPAAMALGGLLGF